MQAHGNPEELEQFAGLLEQYLNTLEEETNRLSAGFNHLGESWNDPKKISFEENYTALLGALASFKENASEQVPYLRIMAGDLRTYLGR